MKKKRYLTTPLYYVNARPHLGHSYTTMIADVVSRHYRQRGDRVTFLTGTDEHGDKIERMAKEQGKPLQTFVDEIASDYQATWQKMNLKYDIFYRTTDPAHIQAVQHALQYLKDKKEIEYREYEGHYCVGCERYVTTVDLNADGLCPDHLRKPELRKEANYFFLMSRYQERLIKHYQDHPESIRPSQYYSEMMSFLKQPLEDLCISRPKERLSWGIEFPFDQRFVTYVWFDALLNYLAATGWPDKGRWDQELWAQACHLIGKDIVKAHGIYWPTMLMALDVPVFKQLQVGGYILMGGSKMSKSLGNVVRPLEVEERFGRETLRYTLLREVSYGMDSTFTLEGYVTAVNAYLANGIGNLVSRVFTLCVKNFKGELLEKNLTDADRLVLAKRGSTAIAWDEGFSELKYQNSLKAWSDLVTAVDLYVNEMKPWALAKDATPEGQVRLQTVLGVCLRMIQALGVLIYPVLPEASEKILRALGLEADPQTAGVGLAVEDRTQFVLASEVPKLFMRVALPTADEGATGS
jgi:methionyl-tRNA synthetase